MVEQDYKGYLIFYPKTPLFAGSWSVYLGSNDARLCARLHAPEEAFTDRQGLDAAIAQAKRRVDALVTDDLHSEIASAPDHSDTLGSPGGPSHWFERCCAARWRKS